MSFSTMLDLLKQKEKGKIVIVKLGNFYVATEEDAVLLHDKLNLKCSCYKNKTCKIGFPVKSLEKYIEKLNETKYAYVIYDYNSLKIELKEIARRTGKHNKETEKSINCLICQGIKKYEEDRYLRAVNKLFNKEESNE